jgi:hypothetical protein
MKALITKVSATAAILFAFVRTLSIRMAGLC